MDLLVVQPLDDSMPDPPSPTEPVQTAVKGSLSPPRRPTEIAALSTHISAWTRLAITETLNGEEGVDQRLWFLVDELDALGPIEGLKDALTRLRKFGGRCVLGFQSISQVWGTYGRAAADAIAENCSSTLILRCPASDRGDRMPSPRRSSGSGRSCSRRARAPGRT
jgi:hypothetical protein